MGLERPAQGCNYQYALGVKPSLVVEKQELSKIKMLSLRQLLNTFKHQSPSTAEEREKARESLFIKVAKLKKLLASSEWREYKDIVEQYIDQCRLQKLRYNFAHAYQLGDEKTFKHIAYLDNDIDFAQRLLGMPQNLINDVEEMERQEKESEASDEVR